MADDYTNRDRDYNSLRDAHTNSHLAKLLSTLALIASTIALAVALSAMNKATDALNLANRNNQAIQQVAPR